MKRIIILTLVFALLVASVASVSGCGKKEDSQKRIDRTNELPEKAVLTKACNENEMLYYRAIYEETGLNPIIDAGTETYWEVYDDNGNMSTTKMYENVKINKYYYFGCRYLSVTEDEYLEIQEYQNETGVQVLYPTVNRSDRPAHAFQNDANIYFQFEQSEGSSSLIYKLDENGNFILNYWKYTSGNAPSSIPEYNSIRIEGENGFVGNDGARYFYVYGRKVQENIIEIRVCYYTYYQFLKAKYPDSAQSEDFFFQFKNK